MATADNHSSCPGGERPFAGSLPSLTPRPALRGQCESLPARQTAEETGARCSNPRIQVHGRYPDSLLARSAVVCRLGGRISVAADQQRVDGLGQERLDRGALVERNLAQDLPGA
jgi:hypothetical protein